MKKWKITRSIFLTLFMAVGLAMGMHARAAENDAPRGLLVADWLDFNNEGNPTGVNEKADYFSEPWAPLGERTYSIIFREEDKDIVLSADDIIIKNSDDEEITNEEIVRKETIGDFVSLSFFKTGEYQLVYTPDRGDEQSIPFSVGLPDVGFYRTDTASEDTILYDLDLAGENASNEFYMVLNSDEFQTVTFDSFLINWDDNRDTEEYLKYEKVSEDVYKVTVNPYMVTAEAIDLTAKVKVAGNEGNSWENEWVIHVENHMESRLSYTDQFTDAWTENGPADLEEDAEYRDGVLWACRSYYGWFALKYGDSAVKADQLKITDIWGAAVEGTRLWDGEQDGFIGMHFPKIGKYMITYEKDQKLAGALCVDVGYPSLGYYNSDVVSEEGLLLNEEEDNFSFLYGKLSNRTFYLLYNDEEGMTISDVNIEAWTWDEEGRVDMKDYISAEPLKGNKGYKLTVKEKTDKMFLVNISCTKTYTWNDGEREQYETYDDSAEILLEPNGKKENFDMSKAAWNYKGAFTYDGKAKEVTLTGLPEGLTVSYNGNKATEAGTYTAKAEFTYDKETYNAPDLSKISELKWSIVKKETVTNPKPEPEEPKAGDTSVVNGTTYQITLVNGSEKAVSYVSGDKKAAKVTIPSTVTINGTEYKVTAIADNAFAGNSELTSVTIPSSVTKVGKNAFKNCTKLKKTTIPKNVTEIGDSAFYGCKKMTSVKFGGTKVSKIGNGAFCKCSSLKSVTIPKDVVELGKDAFRDCKKLSKVTIKGTKIKKIGKNAFKNIGKNPTIKVPKQKKAAYNKLLKKAGYKKTVK